MTIKELKQLISNKELKSISFKMNSYDEEIKISCSKGKMTIKSYNTYDTLKTLLLANDYIQGNEHFNYNHIIFMKEL